MKQYDFSRKSLEWLSNNLPHHRSHGGKSCPIPWRGECIENEYRRRIAAQRQETRSSNPEAQAARDEQCQVERLLAAFAKDPGLRLRLKAIPVGPARDAAIESAFRTLEV
jgi:hypothetical protein